MNVLDLFSGIGGFSLGLERAGMKTAAFCEINEYCQHVLSKNFPARPIFSDIRTLTKGRLSEIGIKEIDVVCGGFPCQPFSIAGKKRSTADDRDLWPEMLRVIKETRPTWVIGENVPNFVNLAFARTKADLEAFGYIVRPLIIPACAVGAQHRRDRIWIIAYLGGAKHGHKDHRHSPYCSHCEPWGPPSNLDRKECSLHLRSGGQEQAEGWAGNAGEEGAPSDLNGSGLREQSVSECWSEGSRLGSDISAEGSSPDISCSGLEGLRGSIGDGEEHPIGGGDGLQGNAPDSYSDGLSGQAAASAKENHEGKREGDWWAEAASHFGHWWKDQSPMGRDIHGLSTELDPHREERVTALGNTVIPQITEFIGRAILEFEGRV